MKEGSQGPDGLGGVDSVWTMAGRTGVLAVALRCLYHKKATRRSSIPAIVPNTAPTIFPVQSFPPEWEAEAGAGTPELEGVLEADAESGIPSSSE